MAPPNSALSFPQDFFMYITGRLNLIILNKPTDKSHALNDKTFEWIESIARLMDTQYKLPGTRFRFGLDPILNLIPFAGNGITVIISFLLVILMNRYGVSGKVVVKMIGNIAIDGLIGAIPVLGNLFDFYYKSNTRNVQLLKDHYGEGKHQGTGLGIILGTFLIMVGVLIGIVWAGIRMLQYFIELIG